MEKATSTNLILKISGGIVRLFLNILFYVIVAMLIIRVGTFAYEFTYEVFGSVTVDAEPGREKDFQILKGESTMEIANKLETSKLIVNKYSFYLKTKLKNYDIMPGTFVLNSSMDYDEILEIITDLSNSIAEEKTVDALKVTP